MSNSLQPDRYKPSAEDEALFRAIALHVVTHEDRYKAAGALLDAKYFDNGPTITAFHEGEPVTVSDRFRHAIDDAAQIAPKLNEMKAGERHQIADRILLLTWLISDPDADDRPTMLSKFQECGWDAHRPDQVPSWLPDGETFSLEDFFDRRWWRDSLFKTQPKWIEFVRAAWHVTEADEMPKAGKKYRDLPHQQPDRTKLSYTQSDLDNAIREYKAERSAQFTDLKKAIARNDKGAVKDAQKFFGRNAIARHLRVKSTAMISKSKPWIAIAKELSLPLKRNKAVGTRHTSKTGRIGHEIAVEQASEFETTKAAPDSSMIDQDTKETIRQIMKLPKKQAEPILAKYRAGEMTDEQARELSKVLLLQP